MNKKAIIALILAISIFVITGLMASEDRSVKEINVISEDVGVVYEIILEKDTLCLYKVENSRKELLKSEKASPARGEDEKLVTQGIKTENREEAFMIFEDFIS